MTLTFFKYQGTGNDFVILDNRDGRWDGLTREQVAALCHRRFGIGADGLMLLSAHPDYDFRMVYFNSDGGESTMCGNGGRCLTRFAYDLGIKREVYRFVAIDGPHEARVNGDDTVSLKMNDVAGVREEKGHFVLNTGSPHYVTFGEGVNDLDVVTEGRTIRNSEPFRAAGINVNFVERSGDGILVRTYERGVEDETYSCGTGVTAAAIVCGGNEGASSVAVQTKGGNLRVEYVKKGDRYTDVWLIGPAVRVFEGRLEV